LDNNDFILKIVAELEKKGIKTGYDKLKKELEKDPAKIDVILNTSGTVGKTKGSIKKLAAELHNELSVEIAKLQKQGQNINFDLSIGDVEEVIQNVINHTKKLEQNFDSASAKAQKFLSQFNKKSGGTLINSAEYKAVQEAINGLGNTHSIDDLNKSMNTLETTYNNMVSSLRNSGKSLNPFINAKNEMAVMSETIKGIGLEFEQLSSKPKSVSDAIGELSTQQAKVDSYTIGTQEWANAYGQLQKMIQKVTAEISNLQKAQSSKSLQPQIDKIQLSIDNGTYGAKYDDLIAKTEQWSHQTDEVKKSLAELKIAYNGLKSDSADEEKIEAAKRWEQAVKSVNNAVKHTKLEYATDSQISSFHQKLQEFYDKNSATHRQWGDDLKKMLNDTSNGAKVTNTDLEMMKSKLDNINNAARQTNKLGKSFFDTIKSNVQSYLPWVSMAGVIGEATQKVRTALTELKEVNTYLTEISKANDKLSKTDLTRIGSDSFPTASKYGKKSTNYLSGVQEASRAGYENAEGIAELSVAAQGAGDMTADLSNQMIIATDKAYKMNGSVEKLTATLDGMNYITNHNAVNMTELSEGMTVVGSTAASFNVGVNETTAALGTMIAATQQSGSEAARAFKAILLNIRQVSDEEEGIDAEGLTKYENACNALNVKLKETKNGVLSLRDPMKVLKELSVEYNKLDESDIRRTNLLSSVGGKLRATQLDALLRQWDTYEAMLQQYEDGAGSMAVEAEKTAKSWEGVSNRVANVWTSIVNNVANSDAIITGTTVLGDFLEIINKVTSALGSLGTIGLGAGLFAGVTGHGLTNYMLQTS